MHPEISEAERFPILTPEGRRFLHALREHPQAPRWNWPNGEQLDEQGLQRVIEFAEALRLHEPDPRDGLPDWIPGFADFCLDEVPFYRQRTSAGTAFDDIPSCSRDDLAPTVWSFVPDSQPLDHLIVFSSSGTTGHPAKMPTHPWTAACGVPLLEQALATYGVELPRGVDQVALTNIVSYPGAYTTAIVVAWLQEAGCLRVNLESGVWRDVADRKAYIDHWDAPVILGDPLAFRSLNAVDLDTQPRALMSSIATLTPAFKDDLERRYGAPVFDMYALTEAGIVAVGTEHGFEVLPHDLYVEVLDEHDQPCPEGVRGEITLTGGRNPFCPLLRYRTGDFASLIHQGGRCRLIDLEGRDPVLFRTPDGRAIHSMEVSRALRRLPLIQFSLSQNSGTEFEFQYLGDVNEEQIRAELAELFGGEADFEIAEVESDPRGRKLVQYRGLPHSAG